MTTGDRKAERWCRKCQKQTCGHERRYPPAIDRLLSRCVERGDCWIYTGSVDQKGYSRLRVHGRKEFGHRLAYEYFRAPIPEGLTFDHLCQQPACVNPWHGDLVPMLINVARSTKSAGAINRQKTHCPQGHPLSGSNVRFASAGRGRVCRTCRAESSRRYRMRLKEEAR